MASRRAIGHWLILLLLSVLFSSLLLRIHLPAALLLGPLIAGLILSLRGVKLSIPRPCYLAAQAIVGCMIARAINPSVFGVLFNNWALVLAILLTTLAISGLTGWLLVRYSALPGATGAWGSSPGGASAMVVMAQEYGADVRLVALMQYLRVLFVVGAAALVVRYALGNEAQEMTQDIVWFPSLTLNFPFTLLLTAVACWLGMRLRIPSGAMLLPMLLGALAQGGGWLMLELPEWLLAMAYAVLGWTVGLQFNKAIFLLALKTLPQIIASIIGLILMCALMALALTHILQMDFMTAYLATSPGGLDTVAIIAAATRADMSFIMALQTLRLFTILLTGPAWRGLSPAMRRGNKKPSQSEGWADRMSASAMRPGNLLSGFQGGQRGVVVRLFGDFVHQLAVDDLIVFIDNDHRTGSQASQRTGGDGDAVVSEEGRAAQRGQGDHIAQAFRAAEAGLGERQVSGNAQHYGVVQFSGQLVEFTH